MSQPSLIEAWTSAAMPPPLLTVSEWADDKRFLPQASAARGGRWRTAMVPALRGLMDVVHEVGVRVVALRKAHQVGGSEAMHNIIGYSIEHDPCPMIFVHPTEGVAEEWSKERLADMIRSTPALLRVIHDKRGPRGADEGESTLALKLFPGGYLATGGANSPNTFARRAARKVFGDDIDRWPAVVGEEGDPIDLLVNRLTSFYDGLAFFVSTPTLKGGRIDSLYEQSDRRRFFIQCPDCGRGDYVTWNDPAHFRVAFDDRDPGTARLECPDQDHGGCGAHLYERDRRRLIEHADEHRAEGLAWQPTATSQQRGLVGFHLPAMLSTVGDVTLPGLAAKWLNARVRGKESLRVFITTDLAEGWEEKGERVAGESLRTRREPYGETAEIHVPLGAAVLTAGVDVQDNRFELQVQAWGLADERWVVDWRTIPGDPKRAETQELLYQALCGRYLHALGHQLPILATCIDTGYATDEMYDFVLKYEHRRIFATKGFAGRSGEPIVGKPSEKRPGKSPRPVRLWPVNVDDAKTDVMNSLTLVAPGPGYTHFPLHVDTVDEEYFAQLTAEHKETRRNKAGVTTHIVWVLDRDRNEALDTAVLSLVAYRLLRPNIRQMLDVLKTKAPATVPPGTAPPTPSAAPAAPSTGEARSRVHRSKYLGR